MLPSVRALLSGIIDYAGLFPPARLSLDEAIRNYARYRTEPDGWMLGRFVIPATRLAELEPYSDLFAPGAPVSFSVLGRGGEGVESFRVGVAADLQAVQAFRARHGPAVLADAYETKPPPEAFEGRGADALRGATEALASAGLSVVYEVASPSPAAVFGRLRGGAAGVKLRCGGLDAAAFPSPEQIAAVIIACRDNGLALKFTAGLHHPARRFDGGVNARMHGFLNVFFAGVFATYALSADALVPILQDEDASHFRFDADGIRWHDWRATTDEIAEARQDAVLSFGSCSFDEPRDDLRALGILS